MVICWAAGSEAPDLHGAGLVGTNQIGAEAAAENCIMVGASENDPRRRNVRRGLAAEFPHVSD
jgi:hypothetical protein